MGWTSSALHRWAGRHAGPFRDAVQTAWKRRLVSGLSASHTVVPAAPWPHLSAPGCGPYGNRVDKTHETRQLSDTTSVAAPFFRMRHPVRSQTEARFAGAARHVAVASGLAVF